MRARDRIRSAHRRPPVIPSWLVFLVFTPIQIYLFIQLFQEWRFWTILFFMLLGFLGNRAARAPWIAQLFFPGHAHRHELRRHVFQGILFLAAAVAWFVPRAAAAPTWALTWPQPWVPLAFLVTLLKASLR